MNALSTCQIICGDSRQVLLDFIEQADLIIMSPPYADARKQHYDSISPDAYPEWFASFHEAFWQALKPSGSLVINIKDKVVKGVRHRYVWRTIEKLSQMGWHCIDDYIWHKKNPIPGYWPNRLKDGWEYVFHLSKTPRPYFNADAIRVPISEATKIYFQKLKNKADKRTYAATGSGFSKNLAKWNIQDTALPSNVLHLAAESRNCGHPAVFPITLPEFFIKLLSPVDGLIIDPFAGSGSTGIAAGLLGRNCILIDNQKQYCQLAAERLSSYPVQVYHK